MIIRQIEVCPRCGKHNPWRKRRSYVVHGERRIYVRCVNCGAKEVVVYRQTPQNLTAKLRLA